MKAHSRTAFPSEERGQEPMIFLHGFPAGVRARLF
jgi:hypothetical protein